MVLFSEIVSASIHLILHLYEPQKQQFDSQKIITPFMWFYSAKFISISIHSIDYSFKNPFSGRCHHCILLNACNYYVSW